MINVYLTIALSMVMGFSVFLSLPIVFNRKTDRRKLLFYNAIAIGILVFLLMDMYGDVAAKFGSAVITNPMELVFLLGFTASFLFFIMPRGSRDPSENPKRTSILAAVGIGFQNLTEGLVFGSAGAAGLVSIYTIAVIGFIMQNVTEGFPIAVPLIGSKEKIKKRFISGAFLIGGMPTIIGTLIGLVFYSKMFIVFFDAIAGAAILYIVLVLFHVNINKGIEEKNKKIVWLTYFGILIGFAIAFVVNYI